MKKNGYSSKRQTGRGKLEKEKEEAVMKKANNDRNNVISAQNINKDITHRNRWNEITHLQR